MLCKCLFTFSIQYEMKRHRKQQEEKEEEVKITNETHNKKGSDDIINLNNISFFHAWYSDDVHTCVYEIHNKLIVVKSVVTLKVPNYVGFLFINLFNNLTFTCFVVHAVFLTFWLFYFLFFEHHQNDLFLDFFFLSTEKLLIHSCMHENVSLISGF